MRNGCLVGIVIMALLIAGVSAMMSYEKGEKASLTSAVYASDDVYIELSRSMGGQITARLASLSVNTKVELKNESQSISESPPSPGYLIREIPQATIVRVYKRWLLFWWLPYQTIAIEAQAESLPVTSSYSGERLLVEFESRFARRLMERQLGKPQSEPPI